MATATKETKPAADPVGRVLQDDLAVHEAAEQILWNLGAYADPTAAERHNLRLVGIETGGDLVRARGRIEAVKNHLTHAGTNAELEQATSKASPPKRRYAILRPSKNRLQNSNGSMRMPSKRPAAREASSMQCRTRGYIFANRICCPNTSRKNITQSGLS